ncbi:hypothetical protein ASD74_17630 [Rhizobium sp. Root564]|nr:hypothetical protein ASD74_17630 [Rhizobium sp. Root564]
MKIFVSVGKPFTKQQEAFVNAVEQRLRAEGLEPKTVGRNTFASQQPLTAIDKLMDECVGVVVIALERKFISDGTERRGSLTNEQPLSTVTLPTPWVQVEAAIAHARGLPLLMIVEDGLHEEGLIAEGFDWFIQRLTPRPASLSTTSFSGILSDWKNRISTSSSKTTIRTANLTFGELLKGLTPAQFWGTVTALIMLAISAGGVGYGAGKTTSKFESHSIIRQADPPKSFSTTP